MSATKLCTRENTLAIVDLCPVMCTPHFLLCPQAPLSVIQGGRSFNSGRPTPQNSFLYTFDDPGTYCVASQGAPGFAGTVHVIDEGQSQVIVKEYIAMLLITGLSIKGHSRGEKAFNQNQMIESFSCPRECPFSGFTSQLVIPVVQWTSKLQN